MSWDEADKPLSAWATKLLGRQCYVVRGYFHPPLIPGNWDDPLIAELMRLDAPKEPALMIADGIHRFVTVSLVSEIPAAVAELNAGINDDGDVDDG